MTTEILIGVAILFLVVIEVVSFINKRKRDTISEVAWRISFRKPIIPFLAGLLCGHLFWPSERCREVLESEVSMPGPSKNLLFDEAVMIKDGSADPGEIFFIDWSNPSIPMAHAAITGLGKDEGTTAISSKHDFLTGKTTHRGRPRAGVLPPCPSHPKGFHDFRGGLCVDCRIPWGETCAAGGPHRWVRSSGNDDLCPHCHAARQTAAAKTPEPEAPRPKRRLITLDKEEDR